MVALLHLKRGSSFLIWASFFVVTHKDSDVSRCVPSKIKTPLWKQITFARRCLRTMR
ncbi:copper-binding protein [Streptococcus pyogenes]|nr:copper chaperone [Streptococcus pyogenes MGAS6180]AFC66626.1 putative copper chaperone [Streptococcus pyogenes MGAS15252]AFC68555.1 putative copper chaperone [Streptococcus pyogenes MGAS1882]ATL57308.1 copper-binding protein [Streptococcus pyogenes]AWS23653.1 copper-binding protein [Streptococcus pyogenes]